MGDHRVSHKQDIEKTDTKRSHLYVQYKNIKLIEVYETDNKIASSRLQDTEGGR